MAEHTSILEATTEHLSDIWFWVKYWSVVFVCLLLWPILYLELSFRLRGSKFPPKPPLV
jgi:hypothetical protein